jgi:gamma-glutamyltranspeptidase/glutathione hydrolase
MSLEDAFHTPRIDVSGNPHVEYDPRLSFDVCRALAERYELRLSEHTVFPANYACPSAVLVDPSTRARSGMGDVMSPWSTAIVA